MNGLTFNTSTRILTRGSENGQGGSYGFKVIATDNHNLDTEYVDVTVTDDL